MRPNKKFSRYLDDDRSSLVLEIRQKQLGEEEALRELEYAYARWVTCVTFLHKHKKQVARTLAEKYETYKVKCKQSGEVPLPPWLFDYEHCVFLIDVNVIQRGRYNIGRVESISGVSEGSVALSAECDTGEGQGT